MKLRQAGLGDLNSLKLFFEEVVEQMNKGGIYIWDEVYPYIVLENDIEKSRFYILENDGEIIATFALCEENGEKSKLGWKDSEALALYIYRLAIKPDFMGKGIATKLIENCMELAKNKGAKYLRLLVVEENKPAFKLYEKNNFDVAEGYYEDEIGDKVLIEYGFEKKID